MTKKDALNSVRLVKELNKKKFQSFEQFAANCIMMDLSDRREIKWIFNSIRQDDPACYKDILKTWQYIIAECFDEFTKNETHELIHGESK